LNQLPAAITYHDLTEGIHTIGGARVATQFLNHPAVTVGYRVEADGVAVVYLVDHEPFSDELWRAGAERGLRVSAVREVEPGRGYAELDRRYVVAGTSDERRETIFLGFRKPGQEWMLAELRSAP